MSDTGRLARPVAPEIAAIVFGADPGDAEQLGHTARTDRAHVVMLAERGLLARATANALLGGIEELEAAGFAPVLDAPRPRGLFLAYERCLTERLGDEVGGALQTGRSRNDLGAAVLRLQAREPLAELVQAVHRLAAIALERADEQRDTTMPAYSHYQAAMPITFGHYLTGIGWGLVRDLEALLEGLDELELSPLGAGAGSGTTLSIDPSRTVALLGFTAPMPNSIEAVASRDAALRLLASAAVTGVTLDRFASDLLLWSTAEFGFLELPDDAVGSSSMMPQKRNPFVLEHVQGRSAAALGAFVAAAGAMRGRPFANSVAVGTEAMGPFVPALRATAEAAELLRLVLGKVQPQPRRMLERAVEGDTVATAVAERLAADGMAFREAHRAVGAAIRAAGRLPAAGDLHPDDPLAGALVAAGSPEDVVAASRALGGPAPEPAAASMAAARERLERAAARLDTHRARWRAADAGLRDAAATLRGDDAP